MPAVSEPKSDVLRGKIHASTGRPGFLRTCPKTAAISPGSQGNTPANVDILPVLPKNMSADVDGCIRLQQDMPENSGHLSRLPEDTPANVDTLPALLKNMSADGGHLSGLPGNTLPHVDAVPARPKKHLPPAWTAAKMPSDPSSFRPSRGLSCTGWPLFTQR